MSFPGYEDRMYKDMMEGYKIDGENFMYMDHKHKGFKIINMDNNQIKNEMYLISNYFYFDIRTKAWLEIFKDVLNKRRINKIKKIKSNII